MAGGRTLVKGFIIVVVGALLASVGGELLAAYLPGGPVKDFFAKGVTFGLEPFTLNLHIFTLTFGLVFKFGVMTVAGLIVAAILLYRL